MNRVDIVIIAEPIISGKNADKVSWRLGYDNVLRVDAVRRFLTIGIRATFQG
jgi:hypothetical protein